MDLQAQKLELIQWLAGVNSPDLIAEFLKLKSENILSEEDKFINESIERGLKDIEEGRVQPHSEIKKLYEKWL